MTFGQRTLLALASIVVAGAAVWFWVRALDVTAGDVGLLFDRLRWWTVPVIFALLGLHIWLAAVRWARIEVALGGERPATGRAVVTGALALGVGTFLPGPIANVACRSLSNRLSGSSGLRGAVGGGLDQIADIAVVMLFVIPALLGFLAKSASAYLVGAVIAAALGWLAVSLIARGAFHDLASSLIDRVPRLAPFMAESLLPKLYWLTLARFVNLTAITLMIHVASGAGSFGAVMVAVPLVTLAISIAMLPGAFGVSEWSFTGVLAGFGDSASEIITFVLANRLILTPLGLLLALVAALYSLFFRQQAAVSRNVRPS